MSDPRTGVAIRKPVKVWNKPLEADFKGLFSALSKLTVHGVTGDWTQAGVDAADAVVAVGFDKDLGQLGWLLIHRALTRAIYELVGEKAPLMRPGEQDLEELVETLDLSLEEAEIAIDQSFLERPKELEILAAILVPLEEWMIGAGLPAAQAAASGARLGAYFVFALNQEWRERPRRYAALKETWETPFTQAAEREQAWRQSAAWLEKQVELPMFDEAFSLRQVYVPLRAYWEEELERDDGEQLATRGVHERAKVKRHWDQREALKAWATVCGPTTMERYLFDFLCREAQPLVVRRLGDSYVVPP